MFKKLLIFGIVALVLGGGVAYYMWNKPHQDMEAAHADISVDATKLFNDFDTDETAANTTYLDKVIEVKGVVKESTKTDDGSFKVILETEGMFGVVCILDPLSVHARTNFNSGETVKMKGTCSGLNLDVQIDRCVEVK
ncbi:MAG: hypothetical protein IPL65_02515 [Lewinellaceae bacterium]|nr:hypothetical protein [Lewinellaceae bacterium]